MSRRSRPDLLLLAALAGCAQSSPTPPPPASRTASIDGRYAGSATGSCGAHQATADVHDGAFTLSMGDGPALRGSADPNGTLRAAGMADGGREVNFTARVDKGDLRGGSYNGRCALAFALARQSGQDK